MDLSKLSQNEKLAIYGSVALIIGGVVGYSYGLTALGILAAIVMLVVVFLPQLSPGTNLPGSRGSLMVAVGGLAGVAMVLALLSAMAGVLFVDMNFRDILFLIAVAGGLLMAWAGWREFQAEGGKFQLGTSGAATATPPAETPPAAAPAPPGDATSEAEDRAPETAAADARQADAAPEPAQPEAPAAEDSEPTEDRPA